MGLASRGDFSRAKNPSARAAPAHPPGPENPPKPPAKKSSLPAKMCKKWGFWAKKCIFGQFVHNFAQNDLFFCGHSPPLQGCQSVGKNPPIYTVLNAAFSAPDPPACGTVVGHQFPTPSHGLRRPFLQNPKNRTFPKYDDGSRKSPTTFFMII